MISPLKKRPWLIAVLLALAVSSAAQAQSQPGLGAAEPMAVDARISAALRQVSAGRVRANIEKLASFGTRATLSAQDPDSIAAGRGIGAAREWIKAEFERYASDCGGCLEVKTDRFTEPAGDRIPQPTDITNVYAVLKGTDAENAKRIVLVTGHYDSRNSDAARREGRRSGGERRWQRNGRQPGMCAGVEQAEISGNDYFSDGRRRGAGTERQPSFREDWRRSKDGISKRC